MRKLLLTTALVALSGSAFAADLPARVAPAPYVAAPPIFSWTGFYIGLNAGAGFNNHNNGFVTTGFPTTGYGAVVFSNTNGFDNGNNAGFTGGAQIGYNWQFGGGFVAGIEADINFLDRGGNGGDFVVTDNLGRTFRFNRGDANNWFGTVRGRLGYAFDRFLPYITGGWAFGGNNGGVSGTVVTAGGTPVALVGTGDGGSRSGWTVGGGVEYAWTNNFTVKLEYLHVDLGSNDRRLALVNAPAGQFFTFNNENRFDVVRAGINWKF